MNTRDQRGRFEESDVVFRGMKTSHKPNQDCSGFQAQLFANLMMSFFVRTKNIAIKSVRNHCALGTLVTALLVLFCPSQAVVDYRGWVPGQKCSKSNETQSSQFFPVDN